MRRYFWEAASGSTPRGRLGAALLLMVLLAALGPDRVARGPRLCLISAVIRRPCPACGMTRAAAALLRGDIRRAVRTNPRVIAAAAVSAAIIAGDARTLAAQRRAVRAREETRCPDRRI